MPQIKNVWTGLDTRKRVIVMMASMVMFLTILTMSRIATSPTMTLLYAGLENSAAGEVVRSLEQRGALFEVRGSAIFVAADQRDELRLTLASEGLPMTGGRGYELLDSLSGFGTTSQMFDAAYWRAKEGELARTIVAGAFVSQARVHIANNGSNPFQRTAEPTASVSVVPAGIPITPAQANGIRYLVASAVAGLSVDNVAIIDANGALIGTGDTANAPSTGEDRAQTLRDSVLRLVEARVGPGNAVVEVSVDTVTETESIRERRFDPDSRVAISTETEERTDSSSNQAGAEVTVASNLPDGDAAADEGSRAQASETRERINYEVSETEHEILRAAGAIKRLTVAVLVNGTNVVDQNGTTTFRDRPPEELDALHDLVASAVGYQEERGDVITLRSMELPSAVPQGTAAGISLFDRLGLDVMSIIQMGLLSVVALVLGLFVVRPILAKPAALPAPALGLSTSPTDLGEPHQSEAPALTGEIETGEYSPIPARSDMANPASQIPAKISGEAEDPVDRLRAMIGDRQEETVEILRGWLEDSEEKA